MTTRCKAIRDWYLRMCYAQASRLNCYPIGGVLAILAIVVIVIVSQHEKGFVTGVYIAFWTVVAILSAALLGGVAWLTRPLWRKALANPDATTEPATEQAPEPAPAPAAWPFVGVPIADLPITASGTRTAGRAAATAFILTEDGVISARNGARS